MIKVEGICKSFNGREVLCGLDLSVSKGEIFGLIGPSGAGKTTFINILTGQIKPDRGEAYICGKSVKQTDDEFYLSMGIVFDTLGLFGRLTGYENLKVFADIHGISKARIAEALQAVGLDPELKTQANCYSKGMRQRLAIARAILHKPKILFLDEPTSGLDPAAKEEIHRLILTQKESGTTVFLTTHKMDEAYNLCGKIALLNNGRCVINDTPDNICKKHNFDKKIAVRLKDGSELIFNNDASSADEIHTLIKNETVESIHSTEPNLEDVFIQVAKGGESPDEAT